MARIVIRTKQEPTEIIVGDTAILICRCGLTRNEFGLCDGSHHDTKGTGAISEPEDADKTYSYSDVLDEATGKMIRVREEVELVLDDEESDDDDDEHGHSCGCGGNCGCDHGHHDHDQDQDSADDAE